MQLVLGIRNQIVTTIYKPKNSLPPLISILLLLPLLLLLLSLLLLTDNNFGQSCWYSFFFPFVVICSSVRHISCLSLHASHIWHIVHIFRVIVVVSSFTLIVIRSGTEAGRIHSSVNDIYARSSFTHLSWARAPSDRHKKWNLSVDGPNIKWISGVVIIVWMWNFLASTWKCINAIMRTAVEAGKDRHNCSVVNVCFRIWHMPLIALFVAVVQIYFDEMIEFLGTNIGFGSIRSKRYD